MKQNLRARRVGLCAIACALLLRLWVMGLPEQIAGYLASDFLPQAQAEPDTPPGPALSVFSPDFVESAPPVLPEAPLPDFSQAPVPELYYAVSKDPDIPALLAQPLTWNLYGQEPSVLILHTHSTESYTRQEESYVESASWRTLDEDYNMLYLGKLLAETLSQAGISVLQDRELYDYPSYNGSYVRARKAIESYVEKFPGIQLILDLHRDASGEGGRQMRTRAEVDGEASAQLMVVVGTNHKGYEENLSLGLKLHTLLEQSNPGITRPLQLRAQRFNQDLCSGALIIEVGAAGNTHPEARLAVQELADAILTLANGTKPEEADS